MNIRRDSTFYKQRNGIDRMPSRPKVNNIIANRFICAAYPLPDWHWFNSVHADYIHDFTLGSGPIK